MLSSDLAFGGSQQSLHCRFGQLQKGFAVFFEGILRQSGEQPFHLFPFLLRASFQFLDKSALVPEPLGEQSLAIGHYQPDSDPADHRAYYQKQPVH
jgi:hypothetical protein